MSSLTLLVTGDPKAEYLKGLERLPAGTRLTISSDPATLAAAASAADVILNGDFKDPRLLQNVFPLATRVRWVHVLSAGIEHILSPEATDKICTFLGHPRTCPHGAPIPPGACCGSTVNRLRERLKHVESGGPYTRDEMNERR